MLSVACCAIAVVGLSAAATAAPFSPAAPAYNNIIAVPVPAPRVEPPGPRTFTAQRPLLYATNENTSQVDGFLQAAPHRLVTGIYGFIYPSSVAVDANRYVYVTDEVADKLLVFKPRAISPMYTATISGEAIDVEVAPNNDAYVSEFNGPGAFGTIQVFKPRARQPFESFSIAAIPLIYYMGFDAKGNLYVDGLATPDPSNVQPIVGVIKAGTSSVRVLPITIGFPGGIAVDRRGRVLVCDQLPNGHLGSVVDVFQPNTWKLLNSFVIGPEGTDAGTFRLDASNDKLFTANVSNGTSDIFDYPSGRFIDSIVVPGGKGSRQGHGVTSVATSPGQF